MDFWIDLGLVALFRLLKDRKGIAKFYDALSKLRFKLEHLYMTDPSFRKAYDMWVKQEAGE